MTLREMRDSKLLAIEEFGPGRNRFRMDYGSGTVDRTDDAVALLRKQAAEIDALLTAPPR